MDTQEVEHKQAPALTCQPGMPRSTAYADRRVPRYVADREALEKIQVEDVILDPAKRQLSRRHISVTLRPTECRLMKFLMTHPRKVLSRSQLLDEVWGSTVYIDERAADKHIAHIRQLLAMLGAKDLIYTVRGRGFRLSSKYAASTGLPVPNQEPKCSQRDPNCGGAALSGTTRTQDQRGKAETRARNGVIQIENLSLDTDEHQIVVGGIALNLDSIPYRLLKCFMTHPGKVFGRAQLLHLVWYQPETVTERAVDVAVMRLRKFLAGLGQDTSIQSVHGYGYSFRPDRTLATAHDYEPPATEGKTGRGATRSTSLANAPKSMY